MRIKVERFLDDDERRRYVQVRTRELQRRQNFDRRSARKFARREARRAVVAAPMP